jgi:Domain of unknown function (DUF6430)
MKILHAIALGIKRHPLKFLAEIFLSYSAIWTLVESVSYFFPEQVKLQGGRYYLLLLLLSLLIAIVRAKQPSSVQIKVGHSNTKITIFFGDIFNQSGYLAVPVNEYFDSELGLPVSPNSLHGIVINKFFGGHPAAFDQLVASDLSKCPSEVVVRTGGKPNRYVIGTTANIKTNSHRFLLFALCVTDITTFKASASLPELVRALEGLCAKARVVLGGEKLVVPLIGSGLSGVGLPANQLLQLILLVLVNETKKNQITMEIDVVIHPSRFDEIDLGSIESFWS